MAQYIILIILFVSFSGFQSVCITPDLQLSLSIFRESVRTRNVSSIDIDVFQRQFKTEKKKKCQKSISSFVCLSETIIRVFRNQFPFFEVEKKCICDKCQLPFISKKNFLNLHTKCMPIFENVPVFTKSLLSNELK